MGYVQTRTATTGELIGGTFGVLAESRREIGLYLLVFAGLGLLLSVDLVAGFVSAASFLLYFPAQFWLGRKMLMRAGLKHDDRFRVFSLFAMAVILGFAIMVGFNFFWIPGIVLGAKWVMAPSYLVAGEGNLFDAIGQAWRTSDGNTVSLSLAYTAIGVIGLLAFWAVIIAASLTGTVIAETGNFVSGPVGGLFFSVSINVMAIMMMALSVAAYRLLSGQMEDLTEVFA